MSKSKIEWCDRTWNPVTGCTKLSPGCANCYAERMSKRLAGRCGYSSESPFQITKHADEVFLQPIRWRKSSRIFVCSMGDLFHEDIPDTWIAAVIAVMAMTYDHTGKMRDVGGGASVAVFRQRHTYMILTKRPERMKNFLSSLFMPDSKVEKFAAYMCQQLARKLGQPFWMNAPFTLGSWMADGMPGLWLGVTAENQEQADKRIPILLQIPAAKRFVSIEPMLGPIEIEHFFPEYDYRPTYEYYRAAFPECSDKPILINPGIDWVICGGESGLGARPMHPDWARSLRDQCQDGEVPFLFKQWGEYEYVESDYAVGYNPAKVGKKKAGRLLDGQLWDQYPER